MDKFKARILIIGVNPYVLIPENILDKLFIQANKKNLPIPIKGSLNGKPYLANAVRYQGKNRLYLNGIMRKVANVDVGDLVEVEIEYDPKPRIEPMPEKFKMALEKNPQAQAVFEKFPPSHKKEILRYLNSMKTEESLDRNIKKVLTHLKGDATGLVVFDYKRGYKTKS